IVTTHSAALIREGGEKNLSFLYKDGKHSRLSTKPIGALLNGVGIETVADTMLLVEDRAAAIFGRLWLAHFDPLAVARVELVPVGGHGNISKALEALDGRPQGYIRIIGVYDGDQRDQVPDKLESASAVLPGREAIEAAYRAMTDNDIERIAPLLGIANLR